MGANSTPSRVLPGKKLAGQYGVENVTIQNLEIVKVDKGRNVLLVKGGVPGPKGSLLRVKTSVKAGK
jgi:large subunit ribosomal protein L3